jgi:hypothetical protein
MPDLHAIVYVSTANHLLSAEELNHLLSRARLRNEQERVTGVLLYSHGNFMQYLEGSAVGVSTIYEVIKADRMHHGIVELLNEPIQTREFAEWSMAFRSISAYGMTHPAHLNAMFEPGSAAPGAQGSAAHILLSKFWNKGIVPAAAARDSPPA